MNTPGFPAPQLLRPEMACDPARAPATVSVDDPRTVLPSLKVTVPVGIPPVEAITVAVKVTDCPADDGLGADVSDVVVVACVTV